MGVEDWFLQVKLFRQLTYSNKFCLLPHAFFTAAGRVSKDIFRLN